MALKIVFRQSLVTGNWSILVDGGHVLSGNEMVSKRTFDISFPLGSEMNAMICLDGSSSLKYNATLRVNGTEFPENRKKIDLDLGESLPMLISIRKYRVEVRNTLQTVTTWYQPASSAVEHIVWYQLSVKTTSGQEVLIERRYSEFDILDQIIRFQTSGHLATRSGL